MNQSNARRQEEEKEVEITNLDFGGTFDIPVEVEAERMVVAETVDTGRNTSKKKENKTGSEIAD